MAYVGPDLTEARLCGCEGVEQHYRLDDQLARTQQISDLFIFLSYFSIPLELLYFLACSKLVFPFKWIIVQFGAFIILCGLTHLVAMWTYHEHTYGIALTQTVMKVLTALVSCATALTLVYVIPELLSLKVREIYLKSKAEQLDREIGVVRTAEETGRNVRMLTSEIRSTLDRNTILKTTLVELGKTLQLWNCMLWMAKPGQPSKLTLTYQLRDGKGSRRPSVSTQDPVVQSIFSVNTAILISSKSPLSIGDDPRVPDDGAVVSIRVPLLHTLRSKSNGNLISLVEAALRLSEDSSPGESESGTRRNSGSGSEYAILVLVLPGGSARRWKPHELEMVEGIADQVAVALSHAAILEESQRTREELLQQNEALVIARQEAETAIKARNDFLAVMNHEMRTPMHAIIALTSLLQEDDSLSKDQKMMVDTIVKSSALLSTLINDILDFSRLEDGSLGLDLTTFQLPALLKEAENLARPMAQAKKLDLTMTVAPGVPTEVIGDEKRLFQVTLNILGNAVKFTKEGSVKLHLKIEDFSGSTDPRRPDFRPAPDPAFTYIRVEITDTGLGIKASDVGKLFNKFVQADSTTTRNYGGTGLGLAICKKFVELMDGLIWIESEGLGRGTKVSFIVKLGVVPPRNEAQAEAPTAASVVNASQEFLSGLRVLVTDDNGVNRVVTRKLLDRLGCNTTVVESGARCLATLEAGHRFAVLLLDLSMPKMDGYEVCQRIHERFAPGERPLIVALTANTDRETRARCMMLDMDGIILKPVALEEMASVLSELLRRQSQSAASPLGGSPSRSLGDSPLGVESIGRKGLSKQSMGTNMELAVLPRKRSEDE